MPGGQFYPSAVMDGGGLRPSPFQFYLTGEENLQLVAMAARVGEEIKVQGRLFRTVDQKIVAFSYTHTIAVADTPETTVFTLGAGALLNVVVLTESSISQSIMAYVSLRIVRGLTGALTHLGTLVQGYLWNRQDLAWPGTPLQRMSDGVGVETSGVPYAPLFPSQQADFVVPANTEYEITAATCLLTASAVAGNRNMVVQLLDAVGALLFSASSVVQVPAGGTAQFSIGSGLAMTPALIPLPHYLIGFPTGPRLSAGERLRWVTNGGDPGDVMTMGRVLARQWYRL